MTLQQILPYLSKIALQEIIFNLLSELETTKNDVKVLHKQLISKNDKLSTVSDLMPPKPKKEYPYENKKSYWLKWQEEQDKLSKPNIYVHDVSLEESIAAEWDKLKNDTLIKFGTKGNCDIKDSAFRDLGKGDGMTDTKL